MISGRQARFISNPNPKRKTQFTLALIRHGRIWVSVYPVFANRLIQNGLGNGTVDCFGSFKNFRPEVKKGNSRFDFQIEFARKIGFVEVKSVSFVEKGIGKFPDAPTERGRRHLKELIELKMKGHRAGVIFVSQRCDTRSITSNDEIDPVFGEWLRKAKKAGVELFGFNCRVTGSSVTLNQPIDITL